MALIKYFGMQQPSSHIATDRNATIALQQNGAFYSIRASATRGTSLVWLKHGDISATKQEGS
jgi:hypothetical protein